MNEPSLQQKLNNVLGHYHYTIEYVGYDTLPFLPGWSHYEALSYDPELFKHHSQKYEEHRVMREEQRRATEHVGCITGEDCLYSQWTCHCNLYGYDGLAHTHK